MLQVYMSFIQFEMSTGEEESVPRARILFSRANKALKKAADETDDRDEEDRIKEDRAKLLQTWKSFEKEHGDEENLEKVSKMMPKRIRKRLHYISEDGVSVIRSFSFFFQPLLYCWA